MKLKLIKARSYIGAVKATRNKPFVEVETEEEAKTLVETGYFELCSSDVSDTFGDDDNGEEAPDYKALSEMTKAELTAYAEKSQINIKSCKTKADILEAISAANGGSYTIMGLQE